MEFSSAPGAGGSRQTTEEAPKIPNDQLDSLVAPIALYPDAMLAQTLAASTYPLEVMQLDQWMEKNKNLKDKALVDAVAKQPWDPSVQSMAAFPDVVQRMAENIQWMTDVGNAVLAQQKDVMDAVQRMRAKAQGTGNLKTGSEQKVETKTTQSGQQVIVVEQANPEAAYVPSYDPEVVYVGCTYRISLLSLLLSRIPAGESTGLGDRPSPWVAYGPTTTGAIAIGMTAM